MLVISLNRTTIISHCAASCVRWDLKNTASLGVQCLQRELNACFAAVVQIGSLTARQQYLSIRLQFRHAKEKPCSNYVCQPQRIGRQWSANSAVHKHGN